MEKYEWKLAHPLDDVSDIVLMCEDYWREEGTLLTKDKPYFIQCLTVALTMQLFERNREFIAVCRQDGILLGYCWYDRGGYTTYSKDEISNAKFHHIDLKLPVRTRVRLLNDMVDQHILWSNQCGIPVICSTSIRGEYDGFMKIHAKRGFKVAGSYAWGRTQELMKGLEWQKNR